MRNSAGGVCCTKLASEKKGLGLHASKGELLRGIMM